MFHVTRRLLISVIAGSVMSAATTASTAQASIVYQYVADVQSFTGSAGTTSVTVGFYLQETVSGADTSYISQQNGLSEGGFQLDRLSGDGWVNSLANQTGAGENFAGGVGGVTGNFATSNQFPWRATNTVSVTAISGPLGTVNGAVTTVLLGTGTFNLGTTTSTFRLGEKKTGANTLSYTDKTNLDLDQASLHILGAGDQTFTITMTVVPEPSSMALCGIAACTMGFGAWRRRQAKKAAALVKS